MRRAWVWPVVTLGAVGTLGACRPNQLPPPPPPFGGTAIETVDRAAVLRYARSQQFVPISGDSQRLMLGASCPADCRYGPLARIDPVAGSFLLDSARLAEGRILARVVNFDTLPYAKLNLGPADTAYWWVDRRGGEGGGSYRSVLISSQPEAKLVFQPLAIHPYPGRAPDFQWRQAQARFLWGDRDEALWVACAVTQCCRTEEQ